MTKNWMGLRLQAPRTYKDGEITTDCFEIKVNTLVE